MSTADGRTGSAAARPSRATDDPLFLGHNGIVTVHHRAFLFTDIVGSTAKWESDSPEMLKALARHDAVLRHAIEPEAGVIFAHTGDGVAAAFETASAAVRAACAIVTDLAQASWPAAMSIAVRVGLHAGEAHRVGDNWFGPTVNRTARVADAAAAGQILATASVTSMADLPAGFACLSHGRFPLKGLDEDLELLELVGPEGSLGPPRVRNRSRTNAHALEHPMVGRTDDLEILESIFDTDATVVCITGVGGMGKTTLARAFAERYLETHDGDVWWVNLLDAHDEADVASLVGRTVREVSGADAALSDGVGLLVLDNCEHVRAAMSEALATRGPGVELLATSRRPLGIAGEIVHALQPLDGESDGSAVALFTEVLRRTDRSRILDPGERAAAGRLCALAGGMPLAIEVIASRCRSLPIEEAERLLSGSLRGFTDTSRPARHASIEDIVRWSFERLEPTAARVFTGLSLFRGFDFGMAAQLWANELEPLALADCLDALVSENLLVFDGRRYSMLEPIRLFAAAELDRWEDRSEWDDRMVAAVLAHFQSLQQDWCHLHPLAIGHSRGANLDLANARRALDICIAHADVAKATELLRTAGGRLFDAGDFRMLRAFAVEVLELARESLDTPSLAGLLWAVGQSSWRMGEPAIALDALEQAAFLYRDAEDSFGSALTATSMGACHWDLGQLDEAGRTMAQALQDWDSVDPALFGVAGIPLFYWYADNDPNVCNELIERAVDVLRDGETLEPHVREIRAILALQNGDTDAAIADLAAAADVWVQADNSGCLAHTLEATALWSVETGRIDLAFMLRNALRTHRRECGVPPLALETMTSKRVDERLDVLPPPADRIDDGGSLGLFGAHLLLLAEVKPDGSHREARSRARG